MSKLLVSSRIRIQLYISWSPGPVIEDCSVQSSLNFQVHSILGIVFACLLFINHFLLYEKYFQGPFISFLLSVSLQLSKNNFQREKEGKYKLAFDYNEISFPCTQFDF